MMDFFTARSASSSSATELRRRDRLLRGSSTSTSPPFFVSLWASESLESVLAGSANATDLPVDFGVRGDDEPEVGEGLAVGVIRSADWM